MSRTFRRGNKTATAILIISGLGSIALALCQEQETRHATLRSPLICDSLDAALLFTTPLVVRVDRSVQVESDQAHPAATWYAADLVDDLNLTALPPAGPLNRIWRVPPDNLPALLDRTIYVYRPGQRSSAASGSDKATMAEDVVVGGTYLLFARFARDNDGNRIRVVTLPLDGKGILAYDPLIGSIAAFSEQENEAFTKDLLGHGVALRELRPFLAQTHSESTE